MSKRDVDISFIDKPRGKVFKSMAGDESACRYFDIEDLNRKDGDSFPQRSVTVGDTRTMPSRNNVGTVDAQTFESAGPNAIPVGDNWLNEGAPARIGGQDVADRGEWISGKYPAGHYLIEEDIPVDGGGKRSQPGFASPEDSGIAAASNFKPTAPGVLKRALEDGQCVIEKRAPAVKDEVRKGKVSFANVFKQADSKAGGIDGVAAAAEYMNSLTFREEK